ncbi:MAG: hypothetical protein ACW96X_03790 [Promethearchaeota archaeon]
MRVKKNIPIIKSIIPYDYFQGKNSNLILEPVSKVIKQEDLNELIIENKNQPFSFSKKNLLKAEEEYLSISVDIHSILSNYPDLTSDQKLDYCNSQRYFMKLYLKEVLVKVNKK